MMIGSFLLFSKNSQRLPYFRQAHEGEGMKQKEFSPFGAFVATAAEFANTTRSMVDFIVRTVESMQRQAA